MTERSENAQILLVGDGRVSSGLEVRLQHFGYGLIKAASIEEAAERVKRQSPDLVVVDIAFSDPAERLGATAVMRGETSAPILFTADSPDPGTDRIIEAGLPFSYVIDSGHDANLGAVIEMALDMSKMGTHLDHCEDALHFSCSRLINTIDGISANLAILDENGMILHVNRAWREFAKAGGPPAANVNEGANYVEAWERTQGECSKESTPFIAGIRKLLTRKIDHFELEYPCYRFEEERWFLGRAQACRTTDQYLVVIEHQDITDQRKTLEKLRESEEKYRQLYQHAPVGIYEIDLRQYRLMDVNDIACRLLGYSRQELLEMDPMDMFAHESRILFRQGVEKYKPGAKQSNQIECEMIGKDGRRFWALMTIRFKYCQNHLAGATVVVHDISKRKLMEDLARKNEERFRLIANNSVDSAFFHDQDLKYVWITKGFKPFSIEQILGRTDLDLLGEAFGRELYQFKTDVFHKRSEMQSEFVVPLPDGKLSYYEITCSPRTNLDGRVIGLSGFMRDITARRRAEEKIRQREAQLKEERKNLEEANNAFKLLLKHRDEERIHQKEEMTRNIRNLILPYFDRLKRTHLDQSQQDLVGIIETSMESLLPGFAVDQLSVYEGLTPRELEVCHLIRMGYGSGKIAKLLNVTDQTVAFHRKNIRRKLGLTQKGQNLRTCLLKWSAQS